MEILAIVKLTHLVGLVMGLGGAMLADYTTLTRGVIRPVSPYTIHQMAFLSRIVAIGLGLLWISGIALIWISTQANPEYVTNQKLWAKVTIVCILTLNGVYIHRTILPSLREAAGRRLFEDVTTRRIAVMTLCGSFSFASWTTPFVLAKASSLNYVTPVQDILAWYLIFLLVMWFAMFTAISAILKAQAYARHAVAMSPGPASVRREMGNLTIRDAAIVTVVGSLSLFAWTMVFVMAKASELNTPPPVQNIAALYGFCLLAVAFVTFMLLVGVAKVQALVRRAAVQTLLPNEPWEMAAQAHGENPR